MSVYVDECFFWPIENTPSGQARQVARRHGGRWCHLWCDAGDEVALHQLAQSIGLRREWFQNRPTFPHYDLVPTERKLAIKAGAIEASLADWLVRRRAAAEAVKQTHEPSRPAGEDYQSPDHPPGTRSPAGDFEAKGGDCEGTDDFSAVCGADRVR